jgi:outer membrane protein assembly factor BamB
MELFAVVPIFTSAGAAALPMIVAAVASMAALLLKPRELARVCRRRPWTASATMGAAIASLGLIAWLLTSNSPARSAQRADPNQGVRFDWAKIAEDLIAQERAGKTPTSLDSPLVFAAATAPGAPIATSSATLPTDPKPDEPKAAVPLVFGYDYSRCSYDGGASPRQIKTRWRFRPDDTMFLSSPLAAGKRVFVAGCQSDLGGYTGLLACLDVENGNKIWQITELGDDLLLPFFSSPALTADGKYLVIGQGLHEDRNCSLLCFEAATGKLHWAFKTTLHIESSPAIFGDMAVVGAGAIEGKDGRASSDPGFVLAVRISDGKELWRQSVNDPESPPAIGPDGTVYIGSGFNGNAVVAIRGATDEQLRDQKLERVAWRVPMPLPVTSAITLAGDLVIAGAGNGDFVHSNQNAKGLVVALDAKTGEIRWQKTFDDGALGKIAYRDGVLVCPLRTGEVVAMDVKDGNVLWKTRISGNAPVLAGCALTGECVYAVSNDGILAVLDLKKGQVLEKTILNDQAKPGSGLCTSSPQVAAGRIYVGSETGGLHCLIGSGATQ